MTVQRMVEPGAVGGMLGKLATRGVLDGWTLQDVTPRFVSTQCQRLAGAFVGLEDTDELPAS